MLKTRLSLTAAVAAFAAVALAAGPAHAASGTIYVPEDFNQTLSDTRATGDYDVVSSGLRVWTEGNSGTDKVAEYLDTDTPLADIGEPSLEMTVNSGGEPGYQLVVDFNNDGTPDGILVGERVYGNDWWLTNGSAQFVKDAAPSHTGGSGSENHGTLDQWRTAFPQANVLAFGFSLGSGVKGDVTINAINFAGTRYTFAEHVVLTSKDQCKKGGWMNSTKPVFKNQGDCVSHFASSK